MNSSLISVTSKVNNIGEVTTNTPWGGNLGPNGACPNYASMPSTGRWLLHATGYGYQADSSYQPLPLGIGKGSGITRIGWCPTVVFDLVANEKIYIWNGSGAANGSFGDLTIYAIRIK